MIWVSFFADETGPSRLSAICLVDIYFEIVLFRLPVE
jgi:hypothetical protein